MGLSIGYGKIIKKISDSNSLNESANEKLYQISPTGHGTVVLEAYAPGWAGFSLADLEPGSYYEVDMRPAKSFGSYTSFDNFRILLADSVDVDFVNIDSNIGFYASKPFFELLNFPDNEGTIGPKAIKNLYDDFKSMRPTVLNFINTKEELSSEDRDWFIKKYDMFLDITKETADTGLIVFI